MWSVHCVRFVVGGAVELMWSPIAILRHLCAQAVCLLPGVQTIGVRSTSGLREHISPQQCRLFPINRHVDGTLHVLLIYPAADDDDGRRFTQTHCCVLANGVGGHEITQNMDKTCSIHGCGLAVVVWYPYAG